MEVAEYRLSIHMGLCHGPIDRLEALYFGEKKGWEGSVTANSVINISNGELFGGAKEEGGVGGRVHVLMGAGGQVLSDELKAKLTGMPGVPGFRGMTSLFFTGSAGGRKGFYWSANQPYIKPTWATVFRAPRGLSAATREFPDGTVNPAHLIFEAMTDTDFGMGAPLSQFNIPAWEAAAQTLYDEGFGVSIAWVEQSTIEQITKDVQDHINGWVFQHPRTGLFELRLVRGDYDPATLRVITPDDAILSNFQRKGLGETVNEIVVTWTNPENEQEETITVHDNGNLGAQGQLVSDSRNYYGARNAELAVQLGQRDIRVASAALCACDAILNRKYWDLVPGDVVKITWPEYGLNELVMRVGKVDYGLPGNQAIKVNLVEDVFAIPAGTYVSPPSTGWIDPSEDPAPIPASLQTVVTLPAYFLANLLGEAAEVVEFPEVRSGVLVTQTGQDTFSYNLESFLADAGGTSGWTYVDQLPTLGYGLLQQGLVRENSTVVTSLVALYGTTMAKVGCFVWIGAQADFNEAATDKCFSRAELCLITASGPSGWTLRRGVLDTQPLEWPTGTPFWILDPDVSFDDVSTIRAAGETARYRARPITSRGMLPPGQASEFNSPLVGRPHFPARPSNVRINNTLWGPTTTLTVGTDAVFTWSNRNRETETSQVLSWTDASISPEAGQETVVELFDGPPASNNSYALRKTSTGTTVTFTNAELQSIGTSGQIGWSVYSTKDGLNSFSRISGMMDVQIEGAGGYGQNYGVSYG